MPRKASRYKGHRSNMVHQFGTNPPPQIQRSTFDRSHGHKTTFQTGQLIPVFWDEVYPGDSVSVSSSHMVRLATPLKPFMDNLYLDMQWWFCPNRTLWDNWHKFMGEQQQPGDSTDFLVPTVSFSDPIGENSLADYLGLPVGETPTGCSALPHRAYYAIYNSWYRDENLQIGAGSNFTDDGPDTRGGSEACQPRGKRKDYFSSALPWPQKGDSPLVPLGEHAPVVSDAAYGGDGTPYLSNGDQNLSFAAKLGDDGQYANTAWNAASSTLGWSRLDEQIGGIYTGLAVDLENATAATINDWRQAFQLQKMLEKDARGGTRYPELLKAHFGVTDPALLVLQRPMFMGSSTDPVTVAPVPQTGASGVDSSIIATPQGNLAAVGYAAGGSRGFRQSFTEHGIIMCIASVRADLNYQQGIDRKWSRQTRYDFYFPSLAHLGEQAILSREIYYDTADEVGNDSVFGYQERWAELRYARNMITGSFRSQAATPLDYWHLAQDFGSRPVLDEAFIIENPPVDRVIAVPSEPHFIGDFFFNARWARPMPVRSIPGLIDHF